MLNNDLMTSKMVLKEIFEGMIKYSTLLQYVRSGKIPAKKIGRQYVFSRKALIAWRERNFNRPAFAKMV